MHVAQGFFWTLSPAGSPSGVPTLLLLSLPLTPPHHSDGSLADRLSLPSGRLTHDWGDCSNSRSETRGHRHCEVYASHEHRHAITVFPGYDVALRIRSASAVSDP